jgi:CO/xanthine dehydrogenase Mo-binding subunit
MTIAFPEHECLAIETLIRDRCEELGLRPADLIRRTAYKNHAKGLRRLDALLAGDLDQAKNLIRGLPAALEVAPDVVERAIVQTRNQIAIAEA